jgi:hypothetical protein
LIDACDDFVMLQEIATAGGGETLLNGVDEIGFVFQVAVHGVLHDLLGILAGAGGDLTETVFLIR